MIRKKKQLFLDNSPQFSNVLGVKQKNPRLLYTVQSPLGHQMLSNLRLMDLKKNISKESGELQLPNLVKTTDYEPEPQSKVKKSKFSNRGG